MTAGRVVVVGSIHVDLALTVEVHPAPGETVRARGVAEHLGGKGANQAVAAAAAGTTTRIVSAVGGDDAGARALAELVSCGVATDAVCTVAGARTGRAVVTVDRAGENTIVVSSGANAHLRGADIQVELADLGPHDLLLLQNEIPIDAARSAVRVARSAGARVVWNAAPAPDRRADLLDCDVLVVNEGELASVAALSALPDDGSPVVAVRAGLGCAVVATRGAAGAEFAVGDSAGAVPAPVVTPVDTTAAGDTFVGYLCAELVRSPEDSPEAAIRFATAAASLTVTRPGATASIPTRDAVAAHAAAIAAERNST